MSNKDEDSKLTVPKFSSFKSKPEKSELKAPNSPLSNPKTKKRPQQKAPVTKKQTENGNENATHEGKEAIISQTLIAIIITTIQRGIAQNLITGIGNAHDALVTQRNLNTVRLLKFHATAMM
ncbi:hypothetical protein NXS19_011644, partial [Fusarium pseudograminearum]